MNNLTNNGGGRPPQTGFRLDKANGKLFGVCAGIGNAANIDPLWIRVGFAAATLLGVGLTIPIYILIALIAKS
jgi:phage shock protein PspC (stress-responsive transcriptional regulator)